MKDTNNLLPYNVWSGTDYNQNITGFTRNPISSNNWSYDGERSLKLTRTGPNIVDYISDHDITLPTDNYKLTVKIYSPEGTGRVMVKYGTDSTSYVMFQPSNQIQTLSIQVDNENIRGVRFLSDTMNASIYIDDIALITVP